MGWGDETGPEHATTNPDGGGDVVSDNVTYSPWLGATIDTTPMTFIVDDVGPAPAAGYIQTAIDAANPADTVNVAAGAYAGAIVNKDVKIIGEADGTSIITSGVQYKIGVSLYTGFRLDEDADGAEIRNFTINCNKSASFYFAVFARGADNVIIDSLTVNHTVQGISNWGGSNWQITNNVIDNTEAAGGGGIAIYLGALPGDYPTCSNNLVQYNRIIGDGATATTYTCPGISLCLDARGADVEALNTEELTGNQILDNTITVTNVVGGVGIEVDVIGLEGDPIKIAAVMAKAPIHDNTVKGNTIDGPWQGMLFINVTNLIVEENVITSCCGEGIVVEGGHSGIAIHNNNIYGNAMASPDHAVYNDPENPVDYTGYSGVYNDDTDVDYGLVDATNNWWGTAIESQIAKMASGNVFYSPWLDAAYLGGESTFVDVTSISLESGWNLISLPLIPEASSIETVLADFIADETVEQVAYYTGDPEGPEGGWLYYTAGKPEISDLKFMNDGKGYWIDVSTAGTLTIRGYELCAPPPEVPPSYNLVEGWNLIGFKSLSPIAAGTYLDELKPVMRAMYGYDAAAGLYTIILDSTKLVPGDGYWLAVSADGTIYP